MYKSSNLQRARLKEEILISASITLDSAGSDINFDFFIHSLIHFIRNIFQYQQQKKAYIFLISIVNFTVNP